MFAKEKWELLEAIPERKKSKLGSRTLTSPLTTASNQSKLKQKKNQNPIFTFQNFLEGTQSLGEDPATKSQWTPHFLIPQPALHHYALLLPLCCPLSLNISPFKIPIISTCLKNAKKKSKREIESLLSCQGSKSGLPN